MSVKSKSHNEGNNEKIQELAKKYRINPNKIEYILCEYGSMENFAKKYMEISQNGNHNEYDKFIKPLKDNLTTCYICQDITEESLNISVFYFCYTVMTRNDYIMRSAERNYYENGAVFGFAFFDGEKIVRALDRLSERELDVIKMRYGIDGKYYTYKEISNMLGESINTIKCIEESAMEKLQVSSKDEYGIVTVMGTPKNLTPEEENRRKELVDEIYRSNLIFLPDKEYFYEPDSIDSRRLKEITSELEGIRKRVLIREQIIETHKFDNNEKDINIYELNISYKAYSLLRKAGIENISQLREASEKELVSNFFSENKECFEEIKNELKELYFMRRDKRKEYTINDSLCEIEELGCDYETFCKLRRAHINTIEELKLLSEEELLAIVNMENSAVNEIQIKLKQRNEVITEYNEKIKERKKERLNKLDLIDSTTIYGLDFSLRTFNALKRNGIITVAELRSKSSEELLKLRSLGKVCVNEIEKKLEELGISELLKEENLEYATIEMQPSEASSKTDNDEKESLNKLDLIDSTPIYELNFSTRTFNGLKKNGIITVAELRSKSSDELLKLRGLGKVCVNEIVQKLEELGIQELLKEENLQSATIEMQPSEASSKTDNDEKENGNDKEDSYNDRTTELESLKTIRDELAREVEKLREQTQDAEKLLARYNEMLGITQNDDKAPNSKGE